MSLSANSKNHRFQVLCLNLSDAATLQMDGRRQSYKQKPRCSSLSRALSGTCLDISSLQQVKEMICCTHGRVTSGNTQQRQTRNVLLEDGNKMSSVPISTETENVYYFPHNKQHHYLNDIELSNEIFKDVDLRFGCPTKTSLLRSRQRAASTTALSKQLKAQILKIQLKTPAFQKAIYSERVRPTSARGDNSYHGFLTGGRYNWAHFVDGKCRTDLGLCIPRSNPNRSFFVAKMNKKEKKRERADLGCCSHKIQTDEYGEKKREKQISQYLIRKESLQLIVQPQPLSAVSTRTFKVRDSDLEGPRQDPPPTPILISTNPATKTRKLTGVKTTIMVPFKENSKVGLDDDGQNIEENTLS